MDTLVLWKSNRIDAEYRMPVDEIVQGFLASPFIENSMLGWSLDRSLRAYVTSPVFQGGLNSVWEDEATFAVVVGIAAKEWK